MAGSINNNFIFVLRTSSSRGILRTFICCSAALLLCYGCCCPATVIWGSLLTVAHTHHTVSSASHNHCRADVFNCIQTDGRGVLAIDHWPSIQIERVQTAHMDHTRTQFNLSESRFPSRGGILTARPEAELTADDAHRPTASVVVVRWSGRAGGKDGRKQRRTIESGAIDECRNYLGTVGVVCILYRHVSYRAMQ